MIRPRPQTVAGIVLLHTAELSSEREVFPVPDIFKLTDTSPSLEVAVNGSRELSVEDNRKRYQLTELTTRVINACLYLPSDREEWLESCDIISFDNQAELADDLIMSSTAMIRSIDALASVRRDMDGQKELISRSGRGSGSRARYRISPDVFFKDERQAL